MIFLMHACLHEVLGPHPGDRRLKLVLARHYTHTRSKVSLECSNPRFRVCMTTCSHTSCTLPMTNISHRAMVSCGHNLLSSTFLTLCSHICFIEHQHFSQMPLTISQKAGNGSGITTGVVAVAIVGHGGKGGR